MSKTLYRTYRPQKFSDVLGQDTIVKTLQNAITQNRIGHAYLFTGPRGTGKTTVARLFATAINTQKRKGFEPVSKDIAERLADGRSMDIIEIDAASNTGVEDIRKLKETIGVTPTEAKYKIYIIDEVHMLSSNAFNALLKTLEEPPEHVIFILATTEIHKVPKTILSRCQRFDFARFNIDDIIKKLTIITKKEKVKIAPEALEMIAIAADGGMRDAESILAQIFALEDKNITVEEVAQILGTTTTAEVSMLLEAFTNKDIASAMTTINSVVHSGYNMEAFIRSIIEKLRILLFLSLNTADNDIRNLISIPQSEINSLQKLADQLTPHELITMIEECVTALQKTKSTTIVQLPLEVASVNICGTKITTATDTATQKSQKKTSEKTIKPKQTQSTKKSNKTTITTPKQSETETPAQSKESLTTWKQCIDKIDKKNKSVSKLLTQCEVQVIQNNTITICTTFSFYKDKIMQAENRAMIEKILRTEFDTPMKIDVLIQNKEKNDSSELLSYAKQLMGGAVTE
ncbi:MAG: DNA polymerase III subunit gamma/tau [Patescibacteria group bacterium]|nr:DNA polymerase III subunit gamma/tau [Patescibacteria group bacterium]